MSYSSLLRRTFIVTGAASGMGRATAIQLAKQGANVALFDLRAPDSVAEQIRTAGGQSIALACNVQDRKEVDANVETVVSKFGALHGRPAQGSRVRRSCYHDRKMLTVLPLRRGREHGRHCGDAEDADGSISAGKPGRR